MYRFRVGASVVAIELDAVEASSTCAGVEPSIRLPEKDVSFADMRSGADLMPAEYDAAAGILGYIRSERRPSTMTREGPTVQPPAGPDPSSQHAQATDVIEAAVEQTPIGRVERVSGSATVLRNGVPVKLNLGDTVAKGDVVQTGADSSLIIRLRDGTVFSLSSSARMVLNDMVYAADAASNSALFTLVEGLIGVVAGQIAKTGILKVDTPVATMAIRGTAVQTEVVASSGVTRFSLLTEPDGTVGSFVLLDRNNPSRVITSISDPSVLTLVAAVTAADLRVTQVAKSADDIRSENDFVRNLFQVFSPEPRQRRGSSDFEDTPGLPANLRQLVDPTSLTVTPLLPEDVAPPNPALPPLVSAPGPIGGAAVEDGPAVRLRALTDTVTVPDGEAPPLVSVPASLPPGVRYLEESQSFYLDPSHRAYQHLQEGETTIVTVNYSLLIAGTRVPASVTWDIVGRNDAPVAVNDRVSGVGEVGQTALFLRANDRDVDGDLLRIVDWTNPLEGSIRRNSAGDLVFDPGDDFRALSAGETATISFAYTVSDGNGGTDTANVTLQVRGTGAFSSPIQTASINGILGFNGQPVSLTIAAPSAVTGTTADLDLIVSLGPVLQPQMNILYLIDISGSTSEAFEGTPVGDLNGDGQSNTVLDAEIASLITLTERVRGLGFSPADVTVTVIPFNGSADPADAPDPTGEPIAAVTFGLGGAGEETIANYLRSLNSSGQTDFEDALRAANDRLQSLDQGNESNFLYFLSDGNGQGPIDAELATLNDVFAARITAVGVGQDADLSQLNEIDNTGGASLLTSPDQIDVSVLGAPIPSGTVVDVDVLVNGWAVAEIGPEDLVMTPSGLAIDASLGGLARFAGDWNTVSATVTFASGEILATNLAIAGALPRSADFVM